MREAQNEIIKSSGFYLLLMKICNVCHRISATDEDHLDCIQKIRIKFDDEDFKRNIPEKLELAKDSKNLNVEVRAILEYLAKENQKEESS